MQEAGAIAAICMRQSKAIKIGRGSRELSYAPVCPLPSPKHEDL